MFCEALFSCNLQQHRQKQHTCISSVKYVRHHGNSVYCNDWIVLNTGLVECCCHKRHCQTGKNGNNKSSVPVVKSINRKRSPPPQGIAAALHESWPETVLSEIFSFRSGGDASWAGWASPLFMTGCQCPDEFLMKNFLKILCGYCQQRIFML